MSLVDKKRKGTKPPSRSTTGLGTVRKIGANKTPRNDDGFLASEGTGLSVSPGNHLTSFQPTLPSNVLNIDQGAELEKLSSKLFGIPLLAGTNYGLRIHPGSDCYVPLVIKDTVEWLAHYVHDEQDTITSLLTEDPDKGLLERLTKKLNKDAHCALSQNIHASTVWHLLKSYVTSLAETPVTFEIYSELVTAQTPATFGSILDRLPLENKSLVKRLLWLLGEFHDQTRTPAEEALLVASFSQLLFNVTLPDYAQLIPTNAGSSAESSLKRDKFYGIVSPDSALAQIGKRELLISSIVQSLMESASAVSDMLVELPLPRLLDDEEIVHRVYRTRIDSIFEEANVFLTPYRLIIVMPLQEEISIPIMTIRTAEMISVSKKKRSRTISLTTKDFRSFQLEFEAPLYAIMFWDILTSILAPKSPLKSFAFKWKPYYPLPASQGWAIYDPSDEFERQGLIPIPNAAADKSSPFRLSKFNASYDVPSYPSTWLVPSSFEDSELRRLLPNRLRQRLPIVMWGRAGNGILLRSDEPDLAALSDSKEAKSLNRPTPDLKLLDALSVGCTNKAVIDMGVSRTYRYAFAGTDWSMSFLNTCNNRALADAYSVFLNEVETSDRKATQRVPGVPKYDDAPHENQWIITLQKVMSTASSIAEMMSTQNYAILMTHSPGNDLDFVVSSLAQIMMDGFYRTIDGLAILLEKDWNSYGFDWSRKLGHSTVLYLDEASESPSNPSSANIISSSTPDQAPLIDLFIEAIWQLTLQFPMHFEYTEAFLLYLLDSIYSGRFGTFLLNTERERESFVKDKTTSFWAHIHYTVQQQNDDSELVNFFYDPDTVFAVLDPRYETSSLKLWYSKHLSQRQHAEMMSVATLVEKAFSNAAAAASSSPKSNTPTKTSLSQSSSVPNVNLSSPRTKTDISQLIHASVTPPPSKDRHSKEITQTPNSSSSDYHSSAEFSVSETVSVSEALTSTAASVTAGSKSEGSDSSSEPGAISLDLSRRGLKTIPPSVIMDKTASKLQSLDFSNNRLNFFPSDLLRLTQLRRLNLSHNPIGDISRDHFFMMGSRMIMLQHLDLSNTNLAYLPDDLANMRYLRILIVKENNLVELPPYISSLSRLEILDVRKNKLRSIPRALFRLQALKVLSLGDNNISLADEAPASPAPSAASIQQNSQEKIKVRIGSDMRAGSEARLKSISSAAAVAWSFRNLVNLEVLDWRGNSKSETNPMLPSALYLLPSVKSLHLEDNNLSGLSPDIGKLTTLTYLNVSYNQIQTLPNELTQLVNLHSLNACHNRLAALPARLSTLPLTSLNLSSNRFKDVPPAVLNLSQLSTLDLSNNSIRKVPDVLVDNLTQLHTLLLAHNQIATLDNIPGIGNLQQLKVLSLQGNMFERLPLELHKLEPTLRELTVDASSSTRITFPPRDILVKGTALIIRYLGERAAMGEADSRVNVVAIGDLPVHKNAFLRRMIRTQSSKQKDTFSSQTTLATGAIGMGSALANNANQSTLNVSALHNAVSAPPLERYEWIISSGNADKLGSLLFSDGTSKLETSTAPTTSRTQGNSTEVRTIVWEVNMDVDMTRVFLHQNFLNDRSFYIITWEISPLKESLFAWIEIVTSRSKKAHFIILGLQSGDTPVQKDYAASMDQELIRHYGSTVYHGFITAPASAKADFKTILTRIEEAILECPLPRESQPASYFSIERMLLATDIKPPLLSYRYFESVAKSCGIKDMRKLLKHLMSLGLVMHIPESPVLDKYLLLDPLWPFTFLSQLPTSVKLSLKANGIVSHEALISAAKSADKMYPESCLPVLTAFQNALGLVFPLVIPTAQLQSNLGLPPISHDAPCVAVEAYTQPRTVENNPATEHKSSFDASSDPQRIGDLLREPNRTQAQYMIPKLFPTLHSWIPNLCEEAKSSVLSKFWPRTLPPNASLRTLQCGRKYVFQTSPAHLFNRLVSRLLSLVKIECLYRSACLIVNASNPYGDNLSALGPSEIIYISLNRPSKTLRFMVRTSYGVAVLADIYETLDSLMRDMRISPVSISLPCSHCLDERWPKPHSFTLEEAEKASISPTSVLYCQGWRPVASKFIAPELSLLNIAVGRHVSLSDITFVKLIGEGAAAEVFLGELEDELVAVKRLRGWKDKGSVQGSSSDIMVGNDSTISKALGEFRREIRFLSKFQHPAIVGLKAVVLDPPCIITEYCEGGNLFEYCHPPTRGMLSARPANETPRSGGSPHVDANSVAAAYPINWSIRLKIALDIAEGMSLLHANSPPIVHRDLKSPNILLQLKSSRHKLPQPQQSHPPLGTVATIVKNMNRSPSTPIVPSTGSRPNFVVATADSSGVLTKSSSSVPGNDSKPSSHSSASPSSGDTLSQSTPSRINLNLQLQKSISHSALPATLEERVTMWTAQDAIAKITDFGLTGLSPAVAGRDVDNPVWLAPEVMMRGVEYAEQTDVYSYAVILYEMLTGREYFGHMSFMTDIERAVLSGQRPLLPQRPTPQSGNAKPHKQQLTTTVAVSSPTIISPGRTDQPSQNTVQSAPNLKLTPRASERETLASYPEDMWKVPELVHLMYHCLAPNPNERPTFFEIVETLKYIIMMHPECASNISFPPGSDVTIHSTPNRRTDVFPLDAQMAIDLCTETTNIEFMGVGESVSALYAAQDGHIWIGFASGTMMCYHVPTMRSSSSMLDSASPTSSQKDADSSEGMMSSRSNSSSSPTISQVKAALASSAGLASIATEKAMATGSGAKELNPLLVGTYRSHKAGVVAIGPYNGNICSMSADLQVSVWSMPRVDIREKPRAPTVTNLESVDDVPTAFISIPVSSTGGVTQASATSLQVSPATSSPSHSSLTPSEQLIATVKSGALRYYDATVSKWKERKIGSSISASSSLLRLPLLGHYWVGCDRKIVRLDDSMKVIDTITVSPTSTSVATQHLVVLCMAKAGPYIWTGATDGVIRIYNERTGTLHKVLVGAHTDEIHAVLQVGNQVWTTGKDRNILIWNRVSFHLLKEIKKAHNDNITSLCLIQNQEVWSGSADKSIGRWSLSTSTRASLLYARSDEDFLVSPRDILTPPPLLVSTCAESNEQVASNELSETSSNPGFSPSPTTIKKRTLKRADDIEASPSRVGSSSSIVSSQSNLSITPSKP